MSHVPPRRYWTNRRFRFHGLANVACVSVKPPERGKTKVLEMTNSQESKARYLRQAKPQPNFVGWPSSRVACRNNAFRRPPFRHWLDAATRSDRYRGSDNTDNGINTDTVADYATGELIIDAAFDPRLVPRLLSSPDAVVLADACRVRPVLDDISLAYTGLQLVSVGADVPETGKVAKAIFNEEFFTYLSLNIHTVWPITRLLNVYRPLHNCFVNQRPNDSMTQPHAPQTTTTLTRQH